MKTGPSKADHIRHYLLGRYIEPARQRGEKFVTISVGDLHNQLGLKHRVPLVISAITAKKFLEQHGLRIVGREGPPSGQSTRVSITYALEPRGPAEPRSPLLALEEIYGIAKDLFADLGGGEAFIRQMRADFFGPEGRNEPQISGEEHISGCDSGG